MSHTILGPKIDNIIATGHATLEQMREITSRADPITAAPKGVGDFYDKQEYADHVRLFEAIKAGKVVADGGVHWLEDLLVEGPGNRLTYAFNKGVDTVKYVFSKVTLPAAGAALGVSAVSGIAMTGAVSLGAVAAAAAPVIGGSTLALGTGSFIVGAVYGLLDD